MQIGYLKVQLKGVAYMTNSLHCIIWGEGLIKIDKSTRFTDARGFTTSFTNDNIKEYNGLDYVPIITNAVKKKILFSNSKIKLFGIIGNRKSSRIIKISSRLQD